MYNRLGPRLGGANLDLGNDPVEIPPSSKWALASVRLRVRHVQQYTHDDTVSVLSHLASFASLTCVRPLHCKLAALGAAIEAGIAT